MSTMIEILVGKLHNAGIRGFMLEWFRSYLRGRKRRVKVAGVLSESSLVERGVPRGSVLGPYLFLIYVNDLLGIGLHGTLYSYAAPMI